MFISANRHHFLILPLFKFLVKCGILYLGHNIMQDKTIYSHNKSFSLFTIRPSSETLPNIVHSDNYGIEHVYEPS